MPFDPGDKNINRKGRPPSKLGKKTTNRELKERELTMLLRKIKPHVAAAILEASRILNNTEAQHHNKLKAATIILDNYRRLALDLYAGEEIAEEEGTEVQKETQPTFSLKVIGEST
jgi:hypothetical protein